MAMPDVAEVTQLAWAVPLACLLPSDLKVENLPKAKTLPVSLDGNSLHFLCASDNKGLTSEFFSSQIIMYMYFIPNNYVLTQKFKSLCLCKTATFFSPENDM